MSLFFIFVFIGSIIVIDDDPTATRRTARLQ
jgi:hypothetical protein